MNNILQQRKTELALLRAAQPARTETPGLREAVASAGVSERKRSDIRAKIDAIEAQMRAEWAAPATGEALRR